MRVLALVCLLVAACEGRNTQAGGETGSGAVVPDDDRSREQARFDSERRPEKVVEALGIAPGSRVADVGAGTGLLTIHLARAVAPNGRVIATDIDGTVLDLLAQRM